MALQVMDDCIGLGTMFFEQIFELYFNECLFQGCPLSFSQKMMLYKALKVMASKTRLDLRSDFLPWIEKSENKCIEDG